MHVINYSGGLCSFWAAKRVKDRIGPSGMVLLFADTLVESPDLYRFNDETSAYLGIPITRISREMTPWQLFRKEGMIGNSRSPICSVRLKREILDAWHEVHRSEIETVYIGFDWTEGNRLDDLRREKSTWDIQAPMTEEPIWDKCRMADELKVIGIALPQAYEQGFPHNNCNRRCVRAGISQWVRLLEVDPLAFGEWEVEEQVTIADFASRGIDTTWATMLKDRRGGITKSMTLQTLRLRVEAGEKMPKYDWGGCGCGATN